MSAEQAERPSLARRLLTALRALRPGSARAGEERRSRRVKFLAAVLGQLGFKVQTRGDVLVARLEKYEHDFIRSRLTELGRLTLCARQLDMLMDSEASPEFFSRAFLAGEMHRF